MKQSWTATVGKVGLSVMVLVSVTYGFAGGPPAGRTGAPGEASCVQCHGGTLNSGAGRVTISGVPETYEPNEEFTLTVRVEHPDRRRWGFQITALDDQNDPAGSLSPVDRNVAKVANGTGNQQGRTYVEHTTGGTFAGQSGGAEWEVKWKAPAQDAGRVTFYAAGNAANNNNASSGDNIYTTAVSTGSTGPMIIAPAFKKGKIVLQANGSNVVAGAVLEVSREGLADIETFRLAVKGSTLTVGKKTRSTPGNLTASDAIPEGSGVTIVVRNPDGTPSASATLTRE